MNALLLAGAFAALVAVAVHGGVGHRWLTAQLDAAQLPSSALFGDADVGRRVMLPRPRALLRPVPPVFALCMTTVALTTGLAAR